MKKIGLFFGTFDPIHTGHEKIAKYFLEKYFDKIWLVITPQNPDKINENLTDESIRLDMAKIFCQNLENISFSDIEYNLPKPNYTADTFVNIKKKYPKNNFSIIMGEDNLVGLEKWKNYEKILEEKIYVYPRVGNASNAKLKNHKSVVFSDAPVMQISSSMVREKIRNNQKYSMLLPKIITEFIYKNKLYL